jgi:chaperonin cofactor prefoldin
MESTSPQILVPTQDEDNTSTAQFAKTTVNILQVDVSALRSDMDRLNQRFDQLNHDIKAATKAETDRKACSLYQNSWLDTPRER